MMNRLTNLPLTILLNLSKRKNHPSSFSILKRLKIQWLVRTILVIFSNMFRFVWLFKKFATLADTNRWVFVPPVDRIPRNLLVQILWINFANGFSLLEILDRPLSPIMERDLTINFCWIIVTDKPFYRKLL